MSAATRGDHINPLVIKELRQGVRSRMLWSAFGLLLVACLGISFTAYLSSFSTIWTVDGSGYFGAFFTCACVIYLLVIPSTAYQSLLREQEGETWPILVMTGLGARRILRGKLASALVVAGLYSSVVLPFLLFAYFLNGIELTTILLCITGALVVMVFLTATAVCWATFGRNRVLRGLMRGAMVFGSLWITGAVAAFAMSWFRTGRSWDRETWLGIGSGLWFMVSFSYLFYETAVARLSLESEDFSRGPRRAVALQMIGTWVLGAAIWQSAHHEAAAAAVTHIGLVFHLSLCGIYLSSDRDGSPRALRSRLRGWSLFLPGALRGFQLSALLIGGSTAIGAVLVSYSSHSVQTGRSLDACLAAGGYAIIYLSLGLLAGHLLPFGRISHHLRSRIAFAAVLFVGALFPALVDVLEPSLAPWPGLLSPVTGIAHLLEGDYKSGTPMALVVLALLALGLGFFASRVLASEDRLPGPPPPTGAP